MKIGIVADTHIDDKSQHLPALLVKEFKQVDMIIHAGDIVSVEVLEQLKALCPNIKAVWGNMDPDLLRKRLPEKEIIKAGKYKIGLTHGCGAPYKLIEYITALFKNDNVDIIIFGHSHVAHNEKKNGVLLFNPGSPTDTIFAPFNSFGVIDINDDKIEARIVKL